MISLNERIQAVNTAAAVLLIKAINANGSHVAPYEASV